MRPPQPFHLCKWGGGGGGGLYLFYIFLCAPCLPALTIQVVAGRLWRLLVVESHLLEHLETLKRDYLLALLPAASASGASELHVQFEARSPLHLVLSPDVLTRYDEIFQLVLRLKRVSYQLQDRCELTGSWFTRTSPLRCSC
jgi:hypothetical protein